jgi:hypothetical protein
MSQNIESVETIIEKRKAIKRALRKKKIIVALSFISFYSFMLISTYFLFTQNLFDFKGIEWKNNEILSEYELNQLVDLKPYIFQNIAKDDLVELEKHPLIQAIRFKEISIFEWVIEIDERKVLATLDHNPKIWLLENGEVYRSPSSNLDLPNLVEYPVKAYRQIAEALLKMDRDALMMIDQIIRKPQSYDELYAQIYMQDGIQVNSGLKGIVVLNDYVSITAAMNPEHECMSIDEIRLVPYSFPCTQALE